MMKTFFKPLIALSLVFLLSYGAAKAQVDVQFINGLSDTMRMEITHIDEDDVETPVATLNFREATAFVSIDHDADGVLRVTAPDHNDALLRNIFMNNLEDEETYSIVLYGCGACDIDHPSNDIGDNVVHRVIGDALSASSNPSWVQLVGFNGAYDRNDYLLRGSDGSSGLRNFGGAIPFGEDRRPMQSGISVHERVPPFDDVEILVSSEDGGITYRNYEYDLTGDVDKAGIVVIHGYLNADSPEKVQLNAFIAFSDGSIAFNPASLDARVQFLNNSADPDLEEIDIYANGSLAVAGLNYRTATAIEGGYDAGIPTEIAVVKSGESLVDAIAITEVFLSGNNPNAIIINGVSTPGSGFVDNPDGRSTEVVANVVPVREDFDNPDNSNQFQTNFYNGATDLPAILGILAGQLGQQRYGQMHYQRILTEQSYFRAGEYLLDIFIPQNNMYTWNNLHRRFDVDLTGKGGEIGLLFLSGFYNENEFNKGDNILTLNLLMPNGDVINFPEAPPLGNFQFIHASPDPSVGEVDVYVDDSLYVEGMDFAGATRYLTTPADEQRTFYIVPTGGSTDDAIITFNHTFVDKEVKNYVIVGGEEGLFEPSPTDADQSLRVIENNAVPYASGVGTIGGYVLNAMPDAPAFRYDFLVRDRANNPLVINGFHQYAQFTPYFDFRTSVGEIANMDIYNPVEDQVFSFALRNNITDYIAQTSVIFATGGFNRFNYTGTDVPTERLFIAFSEGDVFEFEKTFTDPRTSVEELEAISDLKVFPNPTTGEVTINLDLSEQEQVNFQIYDNSGRLINRVNKGMLASGNHVEYLDLSALSSGVYHLRIQAGDYLINQKIVKH